MDPGCRAAAGGGGPTEDDDPGALPPAAAPAAAPASPAPAAPPVPLTERAREIQVAIAALKKRTVEGYAFVDDSAGPAEVQRLMARAAAAEGKELALMPAVLKKYAAEYRELAAALEAEEAAQRALVAARLDAQLTRVREAVPSYARPPVGCDRRAEFDSVRALLEHSVVRMEAMEARMEVMAREAEQAAQHQAALRGAVAALMAEVSATQAAQTNARGEAERSFAAITGSLANLRSLVDRNGVGAHAPAFAAGGGGGEAPQLAAQVRYIRLERPSSGFCAFRHLRVRERGAAAANTPAGARVSFCSGTNEAEGFTISPEYMLREGDGKHFWESRNSAEPKGIEVDLGRNRPLTAVHVLGYYPDTVITLRSAEGHVVKRMQLSSVDKALGWEEHVANCS